MQLPWLSRTHPYAGTWPACQGPTIPMGTCWSRRAQTIPAGWDSEWPVPANSEPALVTGYVGWHPLNRRVSPNYGLFPSQVAIRCTMFCIWYCKMVLINRGDLAWHSRELAWQCLEVVVSKLVHVFKIKKEIYQCTQKTSTFSKSRTRVSSDTSVNSRDIATFVREMIFELYVCDL